MAKDTRTILAMTALAVICVIVCGYRVVAALGFPLDAAFIVPTTLTVFCAAAKVALRLRRRGSQPQIEPEKLP